MMVALASPFDSAPPEYAYSAGIKLGCRQTDHFVCSATKMTSGIVNNNENTMSGVDGNAASKDRRSLGSLEKAARLRCNRNNGSGGRNQCGNKATTTRNKAP